MSGEIAREPCPRCGKPAPLAGRVCPHCKGDLLVDVVLDAAPPDGRSRYQLARSLAALGPPAPSFSSAQQAVAIPHSVLVSGATRELARRVLRLLDEHGGRGRTTAAVADDPAGADGGLSGFVVVAALLIAAGIAGYGWLRHLGSNDEIEMPARRGRVAAQGPPLAAQELAARAAPGTVTLRCRDSQGSGFFVTPDLVLTDAHVLCPAGEPLRAVFADGRDLAGEPAQRDGGLDLALVRVAGANAPPLPLGDATALRTGDRVLFIGTPAGQLAAQEGVVSHTARSLFGVGFLQIDTDAEAGSGGPLLDARGRVVGIVSARVAHAPGLGFALPINYAYAGDSPLLAPPVEPQPDAAAWRGLLAKISAADRKEVVRMSSGTGRPALLALNSVPGKGLVAVVARRTRSRPRSETVSFTFRNGQRVLCRVSALVNGWSPLAAGGDTAAGADSRYLQWLRRNGLQRDLFEGFATLDLQGCPVDELRGSQVVLEGADELADRVGV